MDYGQTRSTWKPLGGMAVLLFTACDAGRPLPGASSDAGGMGDAAAITDLSTPMDDGGPGDLSSPDLTLAPSGCGSVNPKMPPVAYTGTQNNPAFYGCLGHFKDPPPPVQGTTVNGVVRDFQDQNPVSGATVKVYGTFAQAQKDTPIATSAPSGANGWFTIVVPKGYSRIIRKNEGGMAMSNGNTVGTVPVLEFNVLYDDATVTAVKTSTREALPGLVSTTQEDTKGLLIATVTDCNGKPVGGAQGSAAAMGYDAAGDGMLFNFITIQGAGTVPVRSQKWTGDDGAFLALNAPPGLVTVCAAGIVGGGAPQALSSTVVSVSAGGVSVVHLLPRGP